MSKAKIEAILKEYPILKSQIQMKMIDTCCQLSAVSYDQVSGGETNNIYSNVEDLIMAKIEKEEELAGMIAKRDKIEASLKCLNVNEIKAIRGKYFEDDKVHEIAFELQLSEASVYRIINSAIEKLKKCGLCELVVI